MKSFLKRVVPKFLRYFISGIYYRSSSPHSLKCILFPPINISDFFVWNPYVAKTEFIAENIRALFTGNKTEVVHCFRFFSDIGQLVHEEEFRSDDFFSQIKLIGPKDNLSYCSFTHHVEAKNDFQELIKLQLGRKERGAYEQNSGYTIYYPSFASNVGSCVHGNFGGITRYGTTIARQRSLHLYTPGYRFENKNNYDLVFNNPTPSTLVIKILFNDDLKRNEFVHIKSMGTFGLRVKSYTGSLTFESRLPMCRPIIFKNPDLLKSGNFDVFHS